MLLLQLLMLLIAANGSPVLVQRLLGKRLASPIDGGLYCPDGRPLLGASKTWRGLIAAALSCALIAQLMGMSALFGACFGLLSMLGDLLSSFCKRRLGMVSSTRATGLDQLPEALLPLVAGKYWLDHAWWLVVLVAGLFMVLEMIASPLLFRLGVRSRPY